MAKTREWEPIKQAVNVELEEVLSDIEKIWEDIGYSKETREMYYNQAFNHIRDLLYEMRAELQTKKQLLLERIKDMWKQLSVLHTELNLDVALKTYEEIPLDKVEQLLRADLQDLEQLKKERLTALKELLERERDICKKLGVKSLSIGEKALPTQQEIESFKLYLQNQENERNRLENVFTDIRCAITKMMNNLDVAPATSFEHLVCDNPEDFVLSMSNMTKLRELRDQLRTQTEETRCLVERMKEDLSALWKYLDEPDNVCRSFLDKYPGHDAATVNALSAEIKRCKEKRKENILTYVTQMRLELVGLWDLCRFCEAERNSFAPFHSNTFTEDLLTLHELEVDRLRKFYNDNRKMFELLKQHETLLSKIKELLQRANNPDRFHNRGGQLLTEEKERKGIQKKLPKIEAELRHLINEYESTHSRVFTIYGRSLEDVLVESWESVNVEKETIQRARREAKDKSIKKSPLNSSKKTPGTAPQLSVHRVPILGTSKRKLFTSSPNTSAKRRNKNGENKSKTVVIASKVRRSGKLSKIIQKAGRRCSKGEQMKGSTSANSSITSDTTYNQFQGHMTGREELHSSLLPAEILRCANKVAKTTPAVRTPAKPLRKHLPIVSTPTHGSARKAPHSPRSVNIPKLATAPSNLPFIF